MDLKAVSTLRSGLKILAREKNRLEVPEDRGQGARKRSSRMVQNILLLSSVEQAEYFERISDEEIIKLFDSSYPSELVNLLLGIKKSTCRRLFEVAVKHRKRAYLDVITLYYYKDYLTNPLPLTVEGIDRTSMQNYYAIVGMGRDASEEEINLASKLLIHAYQPESFPPAERKNGEIRYLEIKTAFDRLKNPRTRLDVDRLLPNVSYLYPRRDQSWPENVQRLMVV